MGTHGFNEQLDKITTLPSEILAQILEASDSLDEVLTLIKTAPIFHQVYQLQHRTILSKVLANLDQDYFEAQGLSDAQMSSACPSEQKIAFLRKHDASISTLRTLAKNSDLVAHACGVLGSLTCMDIAAKSRLPKARKLRNVFTSRPQLASMYYRLWTMIEDSKAAMRDRPHLKVEEFCTRFIASSPQELCQALQHQINSNNASLDVSGSSCRGNAGPRTITELMSWYLAGRRGCSQRRLTPEACKARHGVFMKAVSTLYLSLEELLRPEAFNHVNYVNNQEGVVCKDSDALAAVIRDNAISRFLRLEAMDDSLNLHQELKQRHYGR